MLRVAENDLADYKERYEGLKDSSLRAYGEWSNAIENAGWKEGQSKKRSQRAEDLQAEADRLQTEADAEKLEAKLLLNDVYTLRGEAAAKDKAYKALKQQRDFAESRVTMLTNRINDLK